MSSSDLLSPAWQGPQTLSLSPAQSDWLFNQDSLTLRLTELCQGQFSVLPLQEGWQTLRAEECKTLGVTEGSQGWVREVYLCGGGQPWVFARSIAERHALNAAQLDLSTLGNSSLGALLFHDSAFQRGELSACQYPMQWLPNPVQCSQLWGRRSSFVRGHLAVLVAEVFLPQFWQALADAHTPS